MNPIRSRQLLTVLAATSLALTLLTAAPAAAVGTTTIRPATLERGDGPRVPQVLDRTILDGDLAVPVDADEVYLLGRSGADYVVQTYGDDGARVERVTAGGEHTTLVDGFRGDVRLSADGTQVFEAVYRFRDKKTRVIVRDAETGERLARRTFAGVVTVLDADPDGAVLGGLSPDRTFRWHPGTDEARRISRRTGYFADLGADRLGMFTDDPYDGGCSVLSTLSAPRTRLWRSCRHAVVGAAPNGRRLLTWPILMDGPLSQVTVHRDNGRLIGRYRSAGTFDRVEWEGNRSLLMVTRGTRKAAVVRCRADDCERASRLVASR